MSITIKQAFQKLAMVTGAAVKNPWFVIRNLNQAFADIADNVVDASGDKVTVTPITDSGTKIAEIKVNNTTSNLYAPGSNDYSTDEQEVGKWIDNKTLFRKVVTSDTAPTADTWSTVALPADISVKMFDAYYVRSTGDIDKFSVYRATSPAEALTCSVSGSSALYRVSAPFISNFSEFRIIIYYTKSST